MALQGIFERAGWTVNGNTVTPKAPAPVIRARGGGGAGRGGGSDGGRRHNVEKYSSSYSSYKVVCRAHKIDMIYAAGKASCNPAFMADATDFELFCYLKVMFGKDEESKLDSYP